MFLALKEMRRAKVRFGLLIVAIGLLVFLILFQQSLQNGLIRGFTGALRSQSAPVLVYSTDGQRTLQSSVLTPELEAHGPVRRWRRRRRSDRPGYLQRDGRRGHHGGVDHRLRERSASVRPRTSARAGYPAGPGEAVASAEDVADGFDVGDVVTIEPAGEELTVVGLTRTPS